MPTPTTAGPIDYGKRDGFQIAAGFPSGIEVDLHPTAALRPVSAAGMISGTNRDPVKVPIHVLHP